ncbi:hypothetical protein DMNBHIDG_03066 [Candidatus Methanoperedenaceae archaeon GB37]|nr:hypothetical protein DMNBHIDG_03066 [Candidatus Methanoperedenaceae archaeon GB37]
MNYKAIDKFNELEKGILEIIRAADIFTIELVQLRRGTDFAKNLIKDLLTKGKISSFVIFRDSYSQKEIEDLKREPRLRSIACQIVLASYTALEVYLVNKFKEYLSFRMKNCPQGIKEAILKMIRFRDLKEIKKNYTDFIGIHIDKFEPGHFPVDYKSNFKENTWWESLLQISKARNEIAHRGISETTQLILLPDAWECFDLCRRWVNLFNINFDRYIYKNELTDYVKRCL